MEFTSWVLVGFGLIAAITLGVVIVMNWMAASAAYWKHRALESEAELKKYKDMSEIMAQARTVVDTRKRLDEGSF